MRPGVRRFVRCAPNRAIHQTITISPSGAKKRLISVSESAIECLHLHPGLFG